MLRPAAVLPEGAARLLGFHFFRNIGAQGFFAHVVAVHTVGTGAAAAAHLVIFAHTALAFIFFLMAELLKVCALFPNFGKGRVFYIAAIKL